MVRRPLFWLKQVHPVAPRCFSILLLLFLWGEISPSWSGADGLQAAEPKTQTSTPPARQLSRFERCKAWVKATFVRQEDLAKYGITLDEGWETKPEQRDVVVLVHGFNSSARKTKP